MHALLRIEKVIACGTKVAHRVKIARLHKESVVMGLAFCAARQHLAAALNASCTSCGTQNGMCNHR
jgi:hypothetical protein